jgi:HEAT repeat protein
VDERGVAEAAADEIAPLRQHPDPRVRMYALIARTVLGPRGPDQAKELIELVNDTREEIEVRRTACFCLAVSQQNSSEAIPFLRKIIESDDEPVTAPALIPFYFEVLQGLSESSRREVADFLILWGDESYHPLFDWRGISP